MKLIYFILIKTEFSFYMLNEGMAFLLQLILQAISSQGLSVVMFALNARLRIYCKMECLQTGRQRMVYLITYSRADVVKFPSRESFSEAVLQAWQSFGVTVAQWVACIEGHHNTDADHDNELNQYHFHMAVKLGKRSRWYQVRKYLEDHFDIKVNFSDSHNTYYSAYRYVTKEDNEALHSTGHPDLTDGAPKTESAIASKKRNAKDKATNKKSKKRKADRLTVYDVCQLVQAKSITSRLELVRLAVAQNKEGKSSLSEFIANRGSKAVDEAISLAKEFSEVEARYDRSKKTRIDILEEQMSGQCIPGCERSWLTAGAQLLERNGIMKETFCTAVYNALNKGRGKYRNVFIHGPANCGKSFILCPLKVIYNTFCNPATGSFAWIGAEEAEVIFLNDLRWHPKIIAWADLLQALEGDTIHLPAPKNVCSRDLELSKDTPFFATSDAAVVLVKAGSVDTVNTAMMDCRWRFFHFWKQIPQNEQRTLRPCAFCFAKFILGNAHKDE